ncbi:hypothetical protein TYRP_002982 [Tyrophagus putrescentiae]|nr:hypothetical protein TYRP_002982 [Tyrophagus putrescentiae]
MSRHAYLREIIVTVAVVLIDLIDQVGDLLTGDSPVIIAVTGGWLLLLLLISITQSAVYKRKDMSDADLQVILKAQALQVLLISGEELLQRLEPEAGHALLLLIMGERQIGRLLVGHGRRHGERAELGHVSGSLTLRNA